jgi:GH25 family lysozyme M1 (1,4-beta-N-acetylmuramidase)
MRTIGIDVSHWEGQIDWQTASQVIGFAYYKCTDGLSFVDDTFEANRAACDQVGLAHAPYHYFQPGLDPLAQADHFIQTAGKGFKKYIVDVEEDANADNNLSGDLLTYLLRVFMLTGIRPVIYTSPGFWNEHLRPAPAWTKNYELIVAHYTAAHLPTVPVGWNNWSIWQFSDYYFVPGCSCEVDGDWFNGDLAACRQWFGNYRQVEPATYSFRARSLFNQLHVRLEPSTLAKETDHLAKGDEVIVEDLGGQDVWVRHSQGWTCVEKGGYRYMEIIK